MNDNNNNNIEKREEEEEEINDMVWDIPKNGCALMGSSIKAKLSCVHKVGLYALTFIARGRVLLYRGRIVEDYSEVPKYQEDYTVEIEKGKKFLIPRDGSECNARYINEAPPGKKWCAILVKRKNKASCYCIFIRNVEPGEEIFMHYGPNYGKRSYLINNSVTYNSLIQEAVKVEQEWKELEEDLIFNMFLKEEIKWIKKNLTMEKKIENDKNITINNSTSIKKMIAYGLYLKKESKNVKNVALVLFNDKYGNETSKTVFQQVWSLTKLYEIDGDRGKPFAYITGIKPYELFRRIKKIKQNNFFL